MQRLVAAKHQQRVDHGLLHLVELECRVELLLGGRLRRRIVRSGISPGLDVLLSHGRIARAGIRQEEVHVREGVRILLLHDVSLGTRQQQFVRREDRINRVGITNTGYRVGVLEQIRRVRQQGLVQTARVAQRPAFPGIGSERHVRSADTFIFGDVLAVVILHTRTVPSKIGARGRIGRSEQVVARQLRTDIVGSGGILRRTVVHRVLQQFLIVAQRAGGRLAQGGRCTGDGLVPLLIIEVETCGKRIGGALVEVILRHRVDGVVDQRQTLLDILGDHFIDANHRTALVLGVKLRLGSLHVGNTQIVGIGRIIVLAEDIDQNEVCIGPAEKRLSLGSL